MPATIGTILGICAPCVGDGYDATLPKLTGFAVEMVRTIPEALSHLRSCRVGAVVCVLPMPDWTAAELLEEVQQISPGTPVLIIDVQGKVTDAVRLAKLGAYQVVDANCDPEELAVYLEAAIEDSRCRSLMQLEAAVVGEPWRRLLVGSSRAMQNVAEVIRLVGCRRCTVLITGETGTGKEVAARAVHLASPRAHLPMIAVNCSALPENLLEAELFGHVKGAFTGAVNHRVGRFEQAHGSTLFLDEIADLPLDLQAKLLRVLQEREFQRLGSSASVQVDVRVVAASNVDLVERVRQGKFREDLYYRLNVVPLKMPALRDRRSDIPVLVQHFIEKICRMESIPARRISREALERLSTHPWPGNVRQLENAVEVAIAMSGDRLDLLPGDFPLPTSSRLRSVSSSATPMVAVPDDGLDFEETVGSFARNILEQALRKTGGNKKQAAEMLGLKRTTLTAKLRSLEALAGC